MSNVQMTKLTLVLDSEGLAEKIHTDYFQKILRYRDSPLYDFLRTPATKIYPRIPEIDDILFYVNDFDQHFRGGIDIFDKNIFDREGLISGTAICSNLQLVDDTCNEIYGNNTVENWNRVWNILVNNEQNYLSSTFEKDTTYLFVTQDKKILENRLSFIEKNFRGEHHTKIVNIKECMEKMDLFAKSIHKYQIGSRHYANRGLWYSRYLFSSIPNICFNGKTRITMSTMYSRFIFLLQSIDKIGILDNLPTNNDIADDIQYHFNYAILLITGIFDALARCTYIHYDMNSINLNSPKISLKNDVGKEFLKKVRDVNPQLREHICKNVDFIKLVYEFREYVAHQDFKNSTTFMNSGIRGTKRNLLQLNNSIIEIIGRLGDDENYFDEYSKWGIFHDKFMKNYFLPYLLAKNLMLYLNPFVRKYLELMGFTDRVETMDIKEFKKKSLVMNI